MSDPIRAILLRVADNVCKHFLQRVGFAPEDACFQVDLRQAEAEMLSLINKATMSAQKNLEARGAYATAIHDAARILQGMIEHKTYSTEDLEREKNVQLGRAKALILGLLERKENDAKA